MFKVTSITVISMVSNLSLLHNMYIMTDFLQRTTSIEIFMKNDMLDDKVPWHTLDLLLFYCYGWIKVALLYMYNMNVVSINRYEGFCNIRLNNYVFITCVLWLTIPYLLSLLLINNKFYTCWQWKEHAVNIICWNQTGVARYEGFLHIMWFITKILNKVWL